MRDDIPQLDAVVPEAEREACTPFACIDVDVWRAMLITQHDHQRKPFVAAYIHANPSVRLLSSRIRHSLKNPITGTDRLINRPRLSLAFQVDRALPIKAKKSKQSFHYQHWPVLNPALYLCALI